MGRVECCMGHACQVWNISAESTIAVKHCWHEQVVVWGLCCVMTSGVQECVQPFTIYGQLKNTRLLRQCSSFVEHMCWHKTSRLQHCTLQEYSDITDRSNRIYGSTHIFSWLLPVQNSARSSPHISLHGHDFDKIIIKNKRERERERDGQLHVSVTWTWKWELIKRCMCFTWAKTNAYG